jgi:hypothetical protein
MLVPRDSFAWGTYSMAFEGPFEGELGGVAYIVGSHIWETVDGGQTWILSKFVDDVEACFDIAAPA